MASNLSKQLRERLKKRGALSRIAEHCGVAMGTVKRWASEEWTPCAETAAKLGEAVSGVVDLSARQTGPSRVRANGDAEKFSDLQKTS